MAGGGLSKARLERIHDAMQGYVDRGEVAGVITYIERRGEAHVDVIGLADLEDKQPLKRDAIMRIASMTKPITAAAAMILVEECKLRLDEPVTRLLPELADRQVLKRIDGPIDETEPARRPITTRDLLNFTLGFGALTGRRDTPIQKAQADLQVGVSTPHDPDTWIKKFAELPLMYQPGDRWIYHTGSDILTVLIQRAAGMPFEQFLKERLFDPLGMKDTGFHVPAGKIERLPHCYIADPKTRALIIHDDARSGRLAKPPAFPSGGGSLLSTVDDYAAFARMMLNLGKSAGGRILARPTVLTMTGDQLSDEQKSRSSGLGRGRSYGFGVGMVTKRSSGPSSPGRYGWDGALGTRWVNDPREDMTLILMTQRMGFGPVQTNIGNDFWTLGYQAIDD